MKFQDTLLAEAYFIPIHGIIMRRIKRFSAEDCKPCRKARKDRNGPADAIGCAVMVAQLATGELAESLKQPSGKVLSGKAGAKARAEKMTVEERSAVAKKAARAR